MKYFVLLLIFLFSLKLFGQPGYQWTSCIEGVYCRANCMVTDSSGNVYTIGVFSTTIDFDPGAGVSNLTSNGGIDVFLMKNESSGALSWAIGIGGDGYDPDHGHSISLDNSGNVLITGGFQGTVDFDPGTSIFNMSSLSDYSTFISKFDTDGNFIWAKQFVGPLNIGLRITTDRSENLYITGGLRDSADFDPGTGVYILHETFPSANTGTMYICKLDKNGNFLWACGTASSIYLSPDAIAADEHENVYIAGGFGDTVDFDPGPGVHDLTASGLNSFVLKLDSAGSFSWVYHISGSFNERVRDMAIDGNDNLYLTGEFSGTADFDPASSFNNLSADTGCQNPFVLKIDENGHFKWAKDLISTDKAYSNAIMLDQNKNIYITGYFSDSLDADPGISSYSFYSSVPSGVGPVYSYVAILDSLGSFSCAGSLGETGSSIVSRDIATDLHGNFFITGYFEDTIDFNWGAGEDDRVSAYHTFYMSKYDYCSSTTGMNDDLVSEDLLPFPNPSSGKISFLLPKGTGWYRLHVYNCLGEDIIKEMLAEGSAEIDLGSERKGIYYIELLSADNKRTTRKIVLQ